MAHFDQHLTEHLDCAHRARCPEAACLIGDELALSVGKLDELRCDGGEETFAQGTHDVLGERARIGTLLDCACSRAQRKRSVLVDQCFDEVGCRLLRVDFATCSCNEFESAQCVARRASALVENVLYRILAHLQVGVLDHITHV